jgi:bifunctional enzyme CysN/CysC
MATGASAAELAVLLVDARKGLLAQTRRHAIIVSLLGIRHAVLAVNKIDLVDFDRAVFDRIADGFSDFAAPLGFKDIKAIPISARYGDNVCSRSSRTPWYSGCHLLEHLETVDAGDDRAGRPFRMPVQAPCASDQHNCYLKICQLWRLFAGRRSHAAPSLADIFSPGDREHGETSAPRRQE